VGLSLGLNGELNVKALVMVRKGRGEQREHAVKKADKRKKKKAESSKLNCSFVNRLLFVDCSQVGQK
jgi:hypothetical protein